MHYKLFLIFVSHRSCKIKIAWVKEKSSKKIFCPKKKKKKKKKKTTYQIMSFLIVSSLLLHSSIHVYNSCLSNFCKALEKGDFKRLNISISANYVDGKGLNCTKMEDFVHELFWRAIVRFSNLILCSFRGT
jgi:hypothetical protein